MFCGTLPKKVKTSIALDEGLLKRIDKEIQTKRFASRTHSIEYAHLSMDGGLLSLQNKFKNR